MTRQQRFKYEMFVRVRDFGAAHAALFPESSKGGQAFARVSSAVAEIDEHMKNHVLGRAEARRVKAATRGAVYEYMKTIAMAARRVTQRGAGGRVPSGCHGTGACRRSSPPHGRSSRRRRRGRRRSSSSACRRRSSATSGRWCTSCSRRRTCGSAARPCGARRWPASRPRWRRAWTPPATWTSSSRSRHGQDPTTFAAWTSARRIEGQRSGAVKRRVLPVVPTVPSSDAAPMAGDSTTAAASPPPSAPMMRPVEPLRRDRESVMRCRAQGGPLCSGGPPFTMPGIRVHHDQHRCSRGPESAFSISGIGVHLESEWVFRMDRNTHPELDPTQSQWRLAAATRVPEGEHLERIAVHSVVPGSTAPEKA